METGIASNHLQSYLFNLRNQLGAQTQSTSQTSPAGSTAPVIHINSDAQAGLDILEKRLSGILQNLSASRTKVVTPAETLPATGAVETQPADVAQRVLNRVNQARPVNSDDGKNSSKAHDANDYLARVKDGIEQGFSQTSERLLQLNQLNQDTLDKLSETYALLQKGLDRITTVNGEGGQTPAISVDSLSQTSSVSFERSFSTRLEIKTTEGDLVTIDLTRKNGGEFNTSFQSNENGSSLSVSRTVFSDVDFQYTVAGDLNEGETNAIKGFIENVAKVADKFFEGNLQNALKKTAALNDFDTEISSYSLQLTYDEILNAQTQSSASISGSNLDAGAISNFLGDLAAASPVTDLLTDVTRLAQDIFNEKITAKLNLDPFVTALPDSTKSLLDSLIAPGLLQTSRNNDEVERKTDTASGEEQNEHKDELNLTAVG